MKTLPNEEELVAIAIALRLCATTEPITAERAPSHWVQRVWRDGVRANVPATWRG